MTEPKDNAGVIAPPPLMALAAVGLGLALDWLMPIGAIAALPLFWVRVAIGAAIVAAGIALPMQARRRFIAAGTYVDPRKPVVRVVSSGVYRYLRNPMYVGLMLIAGGLGIMLASAWTLLMIIPLAITLRNGVVLREERYLERKFGGEYLSYKASVPRWGIW